MPRLFINCNICVSVHLLFVLLFDFKMFIFILCFWLWNFLSGGYVYGCISIIYTLKPVLLILLQFWDEDTWTSYWSWYHTLRQADRHGCRGMARVHQLSLPDVLRHGARRGVLCRRQDCASWGRGHGGRAAYNGARLWGVPDRFQCGVWLVRCWLHKRAEEGELNILG